MDIYIDFDIIKASDLDAVIKEINLLVSHNHKIHLWSKKINPIEMHSWCKSNNIEHMFWTYKNKDAFNYPCVDFVIDKSEKFVNKFIRSGKQGKVLNEIREE